MTIDGSLIRTTRLRHGLGLREFANRCDIDPSTVSRIERGSGAHMTTLRRIAAELDLTMADVMPELREEEAIAP